MTEREQFEMSYAAHWQAATAKTESVAKLAAVMVTMRDGERYYDGDGCDTPYLNNLWEGWQMRAVLAQPVAAEEWQPIETAPKDGTTVLVWPPTWSDRPCSTANYDPDKYAKKPRPYWYRDDALAQISRSRENPPTHWRPLPPPPTPA